MGKEVEIKGVIKNIQKNWNQGRFIRDKVKTKIEI